MKPKQKRKHGAYSLDIYTSMTRHDCMDCLEAAAENTHGHPVEVSRVSGKVRVNFRHNTFFVSEYFEGRFEATVAGTRVYGRIQRTYDRGNIRLMAILLALYAFLMGLLFGILALSGLKASLVGFVFTLAIVLSWMLPFLNERYNQHSKRLLHWIEEQLTVEVADETQTEA